MQIDYVHTRPVIPCFVQLCNTLCPILMLQPVSREVDLDIGGDSKTGSDACEPIGR